MTDTPTLAVTGVTGQLGGAVARRLAAAGLAQRMIARDPSRVPDLPGAVAVHGDFADPTGLTAAFGGVGVLFLVSAGEDPDRLALQRKVVDAAADAGVEHIVYTSFVGAAADCTFTFGRDHWGTEQHIRDAGPAFTFLRDNFYADFMPDLAGPDGVIRGPAGDGRVSVVARDDIAAVAATVLQDPAAHAGRTYDLTGPDALTLHEVATVVTEATGRSVSYRPETIDEAYASRAGAAPRWMLDGWVSTYTAIAAGEQATVSDAVPALLGRPATSLRDLLRLPRG
ncbi:uncharacterized protein YbjT (DUF2867 family) [Nakamurella flavida]|uniref:SDR family oxidoreductase n=1 Tax=Nakamurella flavida TaxID=363630 RepID=UPI00277F3E91|nr:SDR family oxidoreductase [Nakamurella flavida]MDP9778479.1 uncharacterized protein YbjT (DUF2867 family) [Nakamurella flavida]